MPLPGWLGRLNRSVTNRVTRPFAGRLPGFAILTHAGRRTGRSHQTPVNIFRSGEGFVIALTYGRDTDWVRNVMAADGCIVLTRGSTIRLRDPHIVTDPRAMLVPAVIRPLLRVANVTQFLELRPEAARTETE